MRRVVALLAAILAASAAPATAQDSAAARALRDLARAQERQAESLRQLERVQRNPACQADRNRIDAQQDARSMRREETFESRQFFR